MKRFNSSKAIRGSCYLFSSILASGYIMKLKYRIGFQQAYHRRNGHSPFFSIRDRLPRTRISFTYRCKYESRNLCTHIRFAWDFIKACKTCFCDYLVLKNLAVRCPSGIETQSSLCLSVFEDRKRRGSSSAVWQIDR